MEQNRPTFQRYRIKKWTLYVNSAFPFELAARAAEATAEFDGQRGPFESTAARDEGGVVRGQLAFQGRVFALEIREYRQRRHCGWLTRLVQGRRAQRAASEAAMLDQSGPDTPTVAAWGHRGSLRAFVVTVGMPEPGDYAAT